MKKNMNNLCNIDIDIDMALNGITLKADDFTAETDTTVKTMIHHRRHHTITEKQKANAKWRTKFTGKKDRTREDYKSAKEKNAAEKEYRSYSRGGYDRNGIIQNRRMAEATKDALNDTVYTKDMVDYEVDQYVRLIEARDYYQNLVNRLQKEVEIIKWMYSEFSLKLERQAYANNFAYSPIVNVDSYATDALEEAKADLAEVESELDWVRKSGDVPSLLTDDWRNTDNVNDLYDEEEAFDYLRYWDDDAEDMIIKKVRRR